MGDRVLYQSDRTGGSSKVSAGNGNITAGSKKPEAGMTASLNAILDSGFHSIETVNGDRRLRIWMFAAEAAPYAKAGGLADVVGFLPKALENLGAIPTIVIPGYKSSLSGDFGIHRYDPLPGFDIPMGRDTEHADIYRTRAEKNSVEVFLIGSQRYFDRAGIYDDPTTQEGYPDNMKRFIFFMKAGLELLLRLGVPTDILHCHDSHAALIPGLLHTYYHSNPLLAQTGTLFTIHNLAYQGIFPQAALEYAGLDSSYFYPMSPFEFWGRVNFMKTGILYADKVNTVSQTYAMEIQSSSEFGINLEGVLRTRKEDLSGIVNGIDYGVWNPETDPLIPATFSAQDLSGKAQCKKYLLDYFGFPRSQNRIPLIGIVSRLADQKGFDLIAEAVGELMKLDLQLIVLGTGQKKYHDLWQRIAAQYPAKVGVRLLFDNELAHKIEAGSDMFLMPSRYEPCGLNQLYSFRYGTVPIVRATGGLADTVIQYDGEKGTGFRFGKYSSREMMGAIRQALNVYSDPQKWQTLLLRGMSQDWSWKRSAAEYLELYKSIYAKNRASESYGRGAL
jgi:starch synthase